MSSSTPALPQYFDLSKIPALPQTLIELLDACNNPEIDIYGVGELVARDAVISGKILHLANSAFLGTRSPFSEIEQAVIYLGLDTVRNLAICVSVHEAFGSDSNFTGINLPQFWYHSLLTAILAKRLAEKIEYANPPEAYLCGLLHDLGKLLLAPRFPDSYGQMLSDAPSGDQLIISEQNNLGIHHAEAGSQLILHWKLSRHLADAVGHHHVAPKAGYQSILAGIIHIANKLTHNPDAGPTLQQPDHAGEVLFEEDFSTIAAESLATVEEVARALGIKVEKPQTVAGIVQKITEETHSRQELQEKTRQMIVLHGAMDNLLKAHDQDRICQVMEETLVLLAGLRHVFLLLPKDGANERSFTISPNNPLRSRLTELPLPENSSPSIIGQCLENSGICSAGTDAATMSEADQRLARFLDCEMLLAVAVPLTDAERGVLVVGLDQYQVEQLGATADSLTFLAAHVGARLSLDQMNRRMHSELIRKELAGVEKVTRAIAHEISNPLAIIQNYLSVLARKVAAGDDTTQDLQLISDEIGRISIIARQLENLTDLTRRPIATTQRFDHILRDTLTFFRESLFARNNIDVQIRLEADTRPLQVPLELLRQVLAILLTNAADALPNGGRIEIRSWMSDNGQPYPGKTLNLSIGDNGPGVPDEMRSTIFNAGVTTKTGGHLGLGLSIARKLLVDREGSISSTISPQGGACFTVSFPIE